ncbi:MAG TPA: thiamine ABC transporter substrate-binding protein [Acidimicrobiales bacterium]|nr:thiamine ABC transporter substrate-binding protein [Acidimicrobiales bacterium]MDP6213376.1 thiamine ABC transporter substrate-binding protein [Acidimicrobiales bacterium]MDP7208899.1 thiamine ABC transporter substrate-binding protein [Acidimicrobiales bacterium]HJL89207.1 thiamine ABC transporter substrate-binding protein [Acidimicrobiales bacterium]HJO99302.1 thiamine ABC transporter substrate-binding protein [Acidimicrobiales bacterium]
MRFLHQTTTPAVLFVLAAVLVGACGAGNGSSTVPISATTGVQAISGQTVTLVTHDSFWVSEGTLREFTAESGVEVEVQRLGDTGQLVASAILTSGDPLGDVLYGVDNTFLQRALGADLFTPYESPALTGVPASLILDPGHRVTPIDFGDVCVNYWIDAFDDDLPQPSGLADLVDPAYSGMLAVQNPETSSPGMAFLLATIAEYGDGWEEYWSALRHNDVSVTTGWEDAYYGEFIAGGGDRPIVVSYASSPPAEVIYADPPVDSPPTAVLTDTCFRQVEFAGILAGTENRAASEALVDFLLSPTFQEDIPLNMFVFPALEAATLPDEFVDFVKLPDNPHVLDPAMIEANRNDWTERWTDLVLR